MLNSPMKNNNEEIFIKIDELINRVNTFKVDPLFKQEVQNRNDRKVPDKLSGDQLLKVFVTLIAFSQNANSKLVRSIIDSGIFENVFENFSVENNIRNILPSNLRDTSLMNIK